MKNFKEIISLVLAGIMILGSATPVFATIEETQTTDKSENLSTDVYFNQDSTFSVTIPKKVVLDSNKESLYTVTVMGDISSDETILVEPDETFKMHDKSTINTKADVEATVSQDKTSWIFNEFETVANGEIKAPALTAGNWEGKFYFNIKLDSNTVKVISVLDSTGTDLNGKSNNITGYYKEKLLSELTASELVEDASNIKAIIDVNTDEFENSVTATFDVSKIAEVGNQIAIYHYDEETATWEYIDTAIVDENGEITIDMSSFSPVAFEVTKDLKAGLYDAAGNMLCSWEESGIDIETDYTASTYKTNKSSPYYVLTNIYPTATSVVIPEGVTHIGQCSFRGQTGIINVTIPKSVTSIGSYAFGECTNLTNITIPPDITTIETYTFYKTNLISIIIPENVTSIKFRAFANCANLTSVTLRNTIGWFYTGTSNKGYGTKTYLDSNELNDSSTTASYLKNTYAGEYWWR